MTDDIIRMALEAGLIRQRGNLDIVKHSITQIERFAAIVAAHEREKQAKQADIPEWVDVDDYEEQAEQEPVAVVEITYGREPECYVTGNIDDFPEGVFKLYAAPVRTKDLSDYEIAAAIGCSAGDIAKIADARAVIAADREKNRG